MAFNTSVNREDTSMKLRAQNIKQAKDMTRQLETENQRMEQRLNELKMAIRRDREERGQAGFWSKGQQGSLGNYATEVLGQPSSAKSERQSSGKKKKVKVLKDEPIAKSARKVQPGTYGNISMRDAHPPSKIKGPKCGQCEQKAAHVSCHECGEDYCAACFAAFHLKGALRRHRSLPVGSNGGLTARSSSRSSFIDGSGASGDIPPRSQRALYSDADLSVLPAAGRTPSPPANGFSGPSLLDGTYDESEAQASFQQALAEWRHGKATPREHKNNFQTSGASSSRQQKEIKPKAVSVESGTSTDSPQVKKPLEITFTTKSDLTYAEKLLLKKLRREQQGQTTPRQIEDTSCSSLNDTRPHFDDHDAPFFDDAALDAEVQRVSFTALANAVREPSEAGIEEEAEEEEEEERPESHVSIVEIKKSQLRESLKGLEQSAQYQVSEVPDDFVRRSQPKFSGPTTKDAFMTPSPPSSAKRRSPTTRRLVRSPQLPTQTPVVHFSARSVPSSPVSDIVKTRTSPRSHSGTTPRKRSTWVKNSQENLNLMASSEDPLKKKNRPPSRPGTKVKKGASLSKQKISLKDMTGDVPLDLSLEGHPLETCRTERSSAQGLRSQSRNGSRAGSASSRAGSRPSSSRTKSRVSLASIFGEGTLTKTPSSSLKEVADLAGKIKVPRYTPVVGDFLVAGVGLPQEERVLTPSGKRSRVSSARNEKWKISYKLYDLGPRSWRPESSLDIAVDHVEALDIPRYYGSRHPDPEVEKESKVAYSLQDPRRTVLTSQDEVVLDLDTPRSTTLNLTPRSAFHETPRSVTFREDSTQRSGSTTFRVKRPGTPGKSRETTPRDNEATPVVVDGEDMSKFDDDRVSSRQEEEAADNDALNQLEWELASETGRIDADGNISRMSTRISEPDQLSSDGENKTPEAQFDFNNQLRASVLMDDFEEMEQRLMEEEVKALQ